MPYHLWMGNIVNIATDAIVNAANTELKRTPGICEAIFAAADSAKLEEACRRHGHCPIGHSVMTPSFGLPARYIIHVAGNIDCFFSWDVIFSRKNKWKRNAFASAGHCPCHSAAVAVCQQ